MKPGGKAPAQRVAVIIVNWNAGKWLERCLAAVTAQSRPAARILVVDNGDEEDLSSLKARYGQVEFFDTGGNLGFAAANNLAARRAQDCEWLALLNPDAFPARDWLETLLEAAWESDFAFFGSRQVCADDQGILDGAGDVYHVSGLGWRRFHGLAGADRGLRDEEVFGPCAAAALYRRSVFEEAGGFDESFFCYFEDVDLAFRLRLAGHRCLYVAGAVVEHVGSASSGSRSDFSVYYGHRNLVWTYVKNMPGPYLWWYLPQHLLMNIVSLFVYALRGQGMLLLRAKWDALRGLGRRWRQRSELQSRRKARPAAVRAHMSRGWLRPYRRSHV